MSAAAVRLARLLSIVLPVCDRRHIAENLWLSCVRQHLHAVYSTISLPNPPQIFLWLQ